jgi:hypothetical protein
MGKLLFIVQQPVKSYMNRVTSTVLLGLMALTLPACAATTKDPIPEYFPATATAMPATPTIVWFPPSATPTARGQATSQPTPERNPNVGSILLADDFSSAKPWNPAISEEASVDVSRNRMTVAVQPGVYASRIRQGSTFTDFYAEITARPSLCRGDDEYGLLFRAPNNVSFYAFVASCNGTSRVERVRFDRAYPLHEAVPSADVPPGAPGEVRLGVWASGSDIRFFLNGNYQFSIEDPTHGTGSVGVFARSVGDTPVTVIFTDLSVHRVTYSPAASTPTP